MTVRSPSRRPVCRTVGGATASLLAVVCTLVYPGEGTVSLAVTGAGRAVAAPARPVADALPPKAPRTAAPGLAAGPACPTSRPQGWLAAENRRRGDRLTLPPGQPAGTSVVGYADRSGATCGELVTVQLSGPSSTARLVAYRIGDYGGTGARIVWRSAPIRVAPRAVPSGEAYPHLVEPRWPLAATVAVDGNWPPGFYLLVPETSAGATERAVGPAIPLTVRDDDSTAPILFKASTLTWQAYGEWAGWTLYHGPRGSGAAAAANRARVVSLQRPLTGGGYAQMQYMDLPVVRQLERLGLDVAYTTDEDVDARPGSLLGHAEIVIGGHGEYWTRPMYDGLLKALDAGTNLAFLGANNLWWQARLERSPVAARPDRLAVYRSAAEDPVARTHPLLATTLWGPAPHYRDPAAVLGESHAAIGVHGGLQVMDAPSWFLAGSGLTAGSVLPGAVGNEAAGYNVRGKNPPTTQVLLAGVLRGNRGPVTVSANYTTVPSGAAVFAAGTTDWACVPAGQCFDTVPPQATADAVGVLTRNVLLAFAHPRAGHTHPSTPVLPFVAAQLMPRLAPAAIGTYGAPTPESETG
jgi:hypothetical protein